MKPITQIKNRLFVGDHSHGVFRNMAVLALGVGSAKLIGLAAIAVLTRIYTPEHFGVLSVFTAMIALLVPMATLRYVVAIPLPKSDRLAINLLGLCLLLILVSTLLLALLFWLLGPRILPAFSMELLLPYWWLIPIGLLCTSIYEVLTLWATRQQAFKPMAKTQVWQMLLGSTVKIGLGLLAIKPLGLLIGQVVQQSGGIFALTRHFLRSFCELRQSIAGPRMRFLLQRYADLPKFRLPSQFLLVFSTQAPLLFSAALFGAATTGQLGLALMALGLPLQLLGATTGKAYFSEIAKIGKHQPAKIHAVTISVMKRLFLLALAPCILLLLVGPSLFSLVFGEQWVDAGRYASVLAFYLLLQFVTSPTVNVFNVYDRQRMSLLLNIFRTALVLSVLFLVNILKLPAQDMVLAYSLSLFVYYLIVLVAILNLTSRKVKLGVAI